MPRQPADRNRRRGGRFARVTLVALLGVALLGMGPVGAAQAAVSQELFEPWQIVDFVLLQPEELTEPLLLVGGRLKDDVKLPVQVALAIPSGGTIQWAGEIVGQDPSGDPTVTTRVDRGTDQDAVVFTMRRSRTGQLEIPAPLAVREQGGVRTATVAVVAQAAHPVVNISIRLTPGMTAKDVPSGTKQELGPDGSMQFTRTFNDVKRGQKLDLTLGYTLTAAPWPASRCGRSCSCSPPSCWSSTW